MFLLLLGPGALAAQDLGVVNGIPITQDAFDRLAGPYFEEVEARANRKLNPDEIKLLERNVLEELIRQRLWMADARRRGLTIPEDTLDARIRANPMFRVGARIDEARFRAYKTSPSSNYRLVRSQLEGALLIDRYRKWMDARHAPREAELRTLYRGRTEQARLRYLWLTPEAVSLDATASAAEIRAYYDAHPGQFQTPDSARIVYVRIPMGGSSADAPDSARQAAEQAAASAAADLVTRLRSGAPASESAKPHGGLAESGWFRLGDPIRGLGRSDVVSDSVRNGRVGAWIAEPIRVGSNLVVLRIEERRPPRRLPFREAVPLAKMRADAVARDAALDTLAARLYRGDAAAYAVPRITASVVAQSLAPFSGDRPVSDRDARRALERLRARAGADTARGWSDSVATRLPDQIRSERKREAAVKAFRGAAERLRRGDGEASVAARFGGRVERMSRYQGEPPTGAALVEGALLDSLFRMRRGDVVGPLIHRDSVLVIRVEDVDERFVPPFGAVRDRARAAALQSEQASAERGAQEYLEAHRESYLTPQRWVFDYIHFRKAAPESVPVPPDSIAAYYAAHQTEFTEPGRMRARHILISVRDAASPAGRQAAMSRAREALRRARAGEDFSKLAQELSDDRGSAARGGDLGEFTRGTMVREFADAAFGLEPGAVSDIVETQFGFHVIRAEEKRPQRLRPLEECRSEIQGVLGRDLADSLARRAAVAFAAAATGSPRAFDSLAAGSGGAQRSRPVGAGEPLPEVGAVGGIERVIGGLAPGAVTAEPIPFPSGYLVARGVESVSPRPAPFAEVKERVRFDHQLALRRALADSIDGSLRAKLAGGTALDSLLVSLGGLRTTRPFPRSGPIAELGRDPELARDSTLLARVFAIRPGAALPPHPSRHGTVYAVVDTILTLPPSEYAKARAGLRQELLDQRAEAWTETLRTAATIRIRRKDLYP